MKRTMIIMLAAFCGLMNAQAGDLTTDNLTVMKDAVFYGRVDMRNPSYTDPTNGWIMYHAYSTNATTADSSGNNNTCAVYNATWTSSGKNGGGYSFNGSSAYLAVPDADMLDFGTNNFTIAWWENRPSGVNETSAMTRDSRVIMPFYLAYYWNGTLLVSFTSDGTNWDIGSGRTFGSAVIGSWAHYAIRREGTNFYTYQNAVQQDTWSSEKSILSSTSRFEIARSQGTHYLNATLDEIRIYNRALSASEITNLYNATGVYGTNASELVVSKITSSNQISQTDASVTNSFMGKVGIGTNAPSEKLEVVGNATVSGTGSFTRVTTTGVWAKDANGLQLYDDGGAGVFVKDSGDVGIGTTSPSVKLDVTGAGRFSQGVSYVTNLGDIGMGVYTNQ